MYIVGGKHMELKQLESFVAAVEWESFSCAARHLYTTQPTISTHIKQLEDELNVTLIVRTTKSMKITPDGMKLYEASKSMLDIRNRIYRDFGPHAGKEIHLGLSTLPSSYLIPSLIPQFNSVHPGYTFKLWQSDSFKTVDKILDGSLDVGLIGTTLDEPKCQFKPFFKDELVFITPNNPHYQRLLSKNPTSISLLKEPLILREPGSGTLKEATRFITDLGINPQELNTVAYMNDPETVKKTVKNGLGISVISKLAAWDMYQSGDILIYPLPEKLYRYLYIVYRKDVTIHKGLAQFIQYVQDLYSQNESFEIPPKED